MITSFSSCASAEAAKEVDRVVLLRLTLIVRFVFVVLVLVDRRHGEWRFATELNLENLARRTRNGVRSETSRFGRAAERKTRRFDGPFAQLLFFSTETIDFQSNIFDARLQIVGHGVGRRKVQGERRLSSDVTNRETTFPAFLQDAADVVHSRQSRPEETKRAGASSFPFVLLNFIAFAPTFFQRAFVIEI